MSISKEKFNEIKKRYSTLLILDTDPGEALNFVHDLLCAEADAIKESEPYATASIRRLEAAAYEVFGLVNEVDDLCDESEEKV